MSEGFYFEVGTGYCNFGGCVSVCSVSGCSEIATKHYVRGEDGEFWEMYEKSYYAKLEPWLRDRVVILGFCNSHAFVTK